MLLNPLPEKRNWPTVPEGVTAHRDLLIDTYDMPRGTWQHWIDLYVPQGASAAQPVPVVVWIHGGGWQQGRKDGCMGVWLTRHGLAVASVSYRLSGVAAWPTMLHDCMAAVRWLRGHATQFGLQQDAIGAWGDSAGGHLAAMLGVHGQAEAAVQAVAALMPPTDLTRMPETERGIVTAMLGCAAEDDPARAAAASVLPHVRPGLPPFLIVHGEADAIVPVEQASRLHEALQAAGCDSELITLPGVGHESRRLYEDAALQQRTAAFFQRTLCSPAAER